MSRRSVAVVACLLIGAAVAQAEGVGEIDRKQVDAFLDQAEAQVRAKADATKCPPAFWNWLHNHPDIRVGLLLAAHPAKPLHAENLATLWKAAGQPRADRFTSLLLAGALQDHPVDQARTPHEVAGAPDDKDPDRAAIKAGLYPPRIEQSALEQVLRQIERQETQVATKDDLAWPLFPVDAAPYYLLNPLAQSIPAREEAFIWDRFIHPKDKRSRVLGYTDAVYGWEYTKPDVRQKKSDWHPDSVPRILEDGGVCGRLARMEATGKAVLGIPAATAGQPGHCAMMFVSCDKEGRYAADIGQSESGSWMNTTPHTAIGQTPAIAGFEHDAVSWLAMTQTANHVKPNDYAASLAEAWMAEEAKYPQAKAQCLKLATDHNPYHLAAWVARAKGAPGSQAFNGVIFEMDDRLAYPEGKTDAVRRDKSGDRIAKVMVQRLVAAFYRPLLESVKGIKEKRMQVTADLRQLLDRLDDDGLMSDPGLYPLYLRHAAQDDPGQALEIASANLERALLGSAEPFVQDEAQSPTLAAVRAYRDVAPRLPAHERVTALLELCQKIEAVYPHYSKRARPELIGGKTLYPQSVVPNQFYAETLAQCLAALREDGQAKQAEAMQAAYAAERAAMEKEVKEENASARAREMPEYIRQHRDGK